MRLAQALREYPIETRADLQRFFGLNIDEMGTRFTPHHAACCLACLPLGSALAARLEPRYAVRLADVPVGAITDAFSGNRSADDAPDFEAVPISELDEWYERLMG